MKITKFFMCLMAAGAFEYVNINIIWGHKSSLKHSKSVNHHSRDARRHDEKDGVELAR